MKASHGDEALVAASFSVEEAIRNSGHEPFIAWKEVETRKLSPQAFMPFVREQLISCDLVLLLYHPELRGGLIELGIAYALGIPVWLAYRKGERVSSSALGCAHLVLEYADLADLQDIIIKKLEILE